MSGFQSKDQIDKQYAADKGSWVNQQTSAEEKRYNDAVAATKAKMAAAGEDNPAMAALHGVITNDEVGGLEHAFNKDWYSNQKDQEYQGSHKKQDAIDPNAFMGLLTTSPATAQKYMQEQLQTNDLTKGFFGQGGLQDQSQQNYKDAMDIAMGKTPMSTSDQDLYGQLSGNIARQSASEEQSLAQMLADRGLSQAPSGAAGVGFSGLAGNKTERLAQAQQQVAQQRIQNAMQNAATAGAMANQMGALGQNALSNMYNRNLAGRGQTMAELASASGQSLSQQQAQQNQLNTQFQQEQATKGPGLGDILGGAGMGLLGAATGGVGSALAGGLKGVTSGIFGGSSTGSK